MCGTLYFLAEVIFLTIGYCKLSLLAAGSIHIIYQTVLVNIVGKKKI